MHSCLYEGWVRHRRYAPRAHAFRYRLFMLYLDLDELDTVFRDRWLWSTRRPALAWFRRADYMGDERVPLKQAVLDRVEQARGRRPRGPVRLLTHLRYFGYGMNPVSFYYCFDETGERVDTVVAEITNTPWGERHAYVLPVDSDQRVLHFRFDKRFHVSPFMPMDLNYDWRFTKPREYLSVHMQNRRDGASLFDATLALEQRALSGAALARVLLLFPLMTAKVIAGIYWEALRLFLKRVPIHTRPRKLAVNHISTEAREKPL